MWKNYFKTAYRTLFRNKNYTFLNMAGLGVGVAVFLVIFMIISFETGYDGFHTQKDRIFRVLTVSPAASGDPAMGSGVPAPLPDALRAEIPGLKVTDISGYTQVPALSLQAGGQVEKNLKTDVFFADPAFFEIFDFKWLAGDAKATLNDPSSMAMTKSTAALYFGDWKRALGKTMKIANDFTLTVSGIVEDVPGQTDFQLKLILPARLLKHAVATDWTSITGHQQCYVLLPAGMTVTGVDRQLTAFSRKFRKPDDKTTQVLQPLAAVHYDAQNAYAGVSNFSGKQISGQRVDMLWLIASFILIIACVNFVNLATAQAVNRSKEIGVCKVMGSNRGQLRVQFLTETFLLVAGAIILAVALVGFTAEEIGRIIHIPLSLLKVPLSVLLPFLSAVTVVVTLLAGAYPAVILSGFNPITALKNKVAQKSGKGLSLRPMLVVLQFVIAQGLIIACFIFVRQLSYFENGAMGFEKNAIINVSFLPDSARNSKLDYLRNTLLTVKGVKSVSFSSSSPAEEDSWWTPVGFDHGAKETPFSSVLKSIDASYLDTYHLQLVAGRNVQAATPEREFLVNETFVRQLGFKKPEDALNKEINLWKGYTKGLVVGVVKDFHSASFKESIAPVFFLNHPNRYNNAGLKLATNDMPATIKAVAALFAKAYPESPFEYQFLSDKIAGFYQQERQLSNLFELFAGIAIFLSCLGLYGLASFMATQRVKEIGIRKVLGATASHIIYLFSREFVLLVLIAFAIASPLAWYFMHQWVQQYTYHVNLSAWIFLAGGAGSVLIALATISFKALAASLVNPVKSLKSE
ncbi:FtsX-like permease family protein [Mucilaginibacter pineti]|uniref:FtsX-like permease family protein n=1 Tax=Mucilaginibacter pineti TaxID=1391627 RepID=A0A1G7EHY3_9SPHI|nr:ABC transporter permease [Mucilaginibacter pineti]SDE63177.1 FtsX-like permease family protein [Mucilaginibacter pineti]